MPDGAAEQPGAIPDREGVIGLHLPLEGRGVGRAGLAADELAELVPEVHGVGANLKDASLDFDRGVGVFVRFIHAFGPVPGRLEAAEDAQDLKHDSAAMLQALPRSEGVSDAGVDVACGIRGEDLVRSDFAPGHEFIEKGDGGAAPVMDVLASGDVRHGLGWFWLG